MARMPALVDPAGADVRDADYYRQRLEDPSLLAGALAVRLSRDVWLVVPVGGRRRGGYLPVPDLLTGAAARRLLTGRPGFPDVRLRWSPYADCCHVIAWGEPAPREDDDETLGRFYGYSEDAINRFTGR